MTVTVSQVMHAGVKAVQPDASLNEVAALMKQQDIGAVPVSQQDKLLGMVTDRDIVVRGIAASKGAAALTARDVMTKRVAHCRDDDSLIKAVGIMEKRQIRRLPVIDRSKKLVGMLSMGDVCQCSDAATTAKMTAAVSAHHA